MSHLSQKYNIQINHEILNNNQNNHNNSILQENIITKISLGPFVLDTLPKNSFQTSFNQKPNSTNITLKLPSYFRASLMIIKCNTSITSLTSKDHKIHTILSPKSTNTFKLLSSISSCSISNILSLTTNSIIKSLILQPPRCAMIENIDLSTVSI